MTKPLKRITGVVLAALLYAGCGDDLLKYNQLTGFRVLALRASPSILNQGESTTLDALTFVEGESVPGLRYHWSWCPARLPSAGGGDCALDAAAFARAFGLDGNAIDFELGTEATATFIYPGEAETYRAACTNAAGSAAQGGFVFSCEGGFPISIRADITYGEQTIRVQKDVHLRFGDLPGNTNPVLGAVSILKVGGETTPTPWPEATAARVTLGEHYEVRVEVDEASAERFVPTATVVDPAPQERRENLYITWFVSSGDTNERRTSLVQGAGSLAELGKNQWQLPKAGDEKRDTARLFLVLRDERGGVSWLARTVELAR